jgi:NADH-quinone oxidoreductase subunit E
MANEIIARWAPGTPPPVPGPPVETELANAVEGILARFPETRSALVPVLWLVQQRLGWLRPEVIAWVGRRLGLGPAVVDEVASFYDMFRWVEPAHHVVELCGSLPCHLCGCDQLLGVVERRLGVRSGRSQDGAWEVRIVQCLGRCDGAPTVVLDGVVYGDVNAEKLGRLLDACE